MDGTGFLLRQNNFCLIKVVTLIRKEFLFQQDRAMEDNESLVTGFAVSDQWLLYMLMDYILIIHSFFNNLFFDLNNPSYELLIDGDLNLILGILDRSATKRFSLTAPGKILKQKLFHHNLIAVWRFHNKNKREYTF